MVAKKTKAKAAAKAAAKTNPTIAVPKGKNTKKTETKK